MQLDNTAYGWLPSLSFASPTAMLMNICIVSCPIGLTSNCNHKYAVLTASKPKKNTHNKYIYHYGKKFWVESLENTTSMAIC